MCTFDDESFRKGLKHAMRAHQRFQKAVAKHINQQMTVNRSGLSQKHTSTGVCDTGTRHH